MTGLGPGPHLPAWHSSGSSACLFASRASTPATSDCKLASHPRYQSGLAFQHFFLQVAGYIHNCNRTLLSTYVCIITGILCANITVARECVGGGLREVPRSQGYQPKHLTKLQGLEEGLLVCAYAGGLRPISCKWTSPTSRNTYQNLVLPTRT